MYKDTQGSSCETSLVTLLQAAGHVWRRAAAASIRHAIVAVDGNGDGLALQHALLAVDGRDHQPAVAAHRAEEQIAAHVGALAVVGRLARLRHREPHALRDALLLGGSELREAGGALGILGALAYGTRRVLMV